MDGLAEVVYCFALVVVAAERKSAEVFPSKSHSIEHGPIIEGILNPDNKIANLKHIDFWIEHKLIVASSQQLYLLIGSILQKCSDVGLERVKCF